MILILDIFLFISFLKKIKSYQPCISTHLRELRLVGKLEQRFRFAERGGGGQERQGKEAKREKLKKKGMEESG